MNPAELHFALTKGPHIVEYAIANLRSMIADPMPYIDVAMGGSVLVVGAGPTLDLDRVRSAYDAGVSIWTVNNAARAVCSVCSPDVIVVRESLDVSSQLDDLAHAPVMVVCDLSVHPRVWEKAREMGGAFFVSATPAMFALAASLDVAPVYGGTASLTAAVALADGCDWIGLEGVDLAYARDGRGYAVGARYQASIARVDGTTATLIGGDEQRELAERSGQRPPPQAATVTLVHARDGGAPLHAQGPWLSQIEWLEAYAARRPDCDEWLRGMAIPSARNRGLGLADLVGWGDEPARPGAPVVHGVSVSAGRVAAAIAEVERQRVCQRAIIDAVTSGVDATSVPDLIDGAVMFDTASAGRVTLASGEPESRRLRAIYAAYEAGMGTGDAGH